MGQIVAGQAAVEFRKLCGNQAGLFIGNAARRAVHPAHTARAGAQGIELRIVHRLAEEALAAQQHEIEPQHVVARLAVGTAALAAGIGVDHATEGGAVGGGQFRRKEHAVGFERRIELVLHHTCLHPHPAFGGIDLQNAVHVARQVHHQPVGE